MRSAVVALGLLGACGRSDGPTTSPADAAPPVPFIEVLIALTGSGCNEGGCHSPPEPAAGLDLVDAPHGQLVDRDASGGAGLGMPASVMAFDIWVMLAVALACLPVFMTGREIARWEGGVFVGYYIAYVAYLILAAQQHDALPAFSGVMMSFVVPITIVTLVVTMFGRRSGGAPGQGSG